ncbi:hypothetical protein [Novosphingobium rhizosphaerae]|uniref:hypothetical protein n=1 Tax=Novosphingobium rhizosphaerae TaxID=1551649 RepID=UPI0017C09592
MVLTSHDAVGDTGKKTGFWLEEFAATFEKGPDWAPFLVTDGKLIPAQNPASSDAVAHALIDQLR